MVRGLGVAFLREVWVSTRRVAAVRAEGTASGKSSSLEMTGHSGEEASGGKWRGYRLWVWQARVAFGIFLNKRNEKPLKGFK